MTGRIRLACRDCDTDVCDGINEIPADWKEVIEVQSFDEALAPVDPSNNLQRLTDWYTHLGLCPNCQQEGK